MKAPKDVFFVALILHNNLYTLAATTKKGVEKWKTLQDIIDNYHKTIDNLLKNLTIFQQVTNNFIAVTNNILSRRVYHFTTPTTTAIIACGEAIYLFMHIKATYIHIILYVEWCTYTRRKTAKILV